MQQPVRSCVYWSSIRHVDLKHATNPTSAVMWPMALIPGENLTFLERKGPRNKEATPQGYTKKKALCGEVFGILAEGPAGPPPGRVAGCTRSAVQLLFWREAWVFRVRVVRRRFAGAARLSVSALHVQSRGYAPRA
jgi:hypothetical protein